MKKNKIVLAFLMLFALAMVFSWINSFKGQEDVSRQESEAPLKKIRVGLYGAKDQALFSFDFAQKKDIYKKYGVEIEKIVSEINPPQVLLAAGEVDVIFSPISGSLSQFYNDADLKLIAVPYAEFNDYVLSHVSKDNIRSIKKVGSGKFGGTGQLTTILALKNLGINYKDVEFAYVPALALRLEMFKKGEFDFIVIDFGEVQKTDLDMTNTFILKPGEIPRDYKAYRGIITTDKVIKDNPEILDDFVSAIHESTEYFSDNREEAVSFIESEYNFSNDQAQEFYDNFKNAKEKATYVPDIANLQDMASIIKEEFKPTNPERDLREFIYDAFARTAISQDAK